MAEAQKDIKDLGQKMHQVVDEIVRNFDKRVRQLELDMPEEELEDAMQAAKKVAWMDLLKNGPGSLIATEAWNQLIESAQGQQQDRGR